MLYSYVMYATQSNAVPWQIWLFILGGAAMIVGPAIAIGMNYRRLHKQPEESPPPVYTEINTRATVVELACWVRMAGSYKAPKAVQEFAVVFQTEDGEMIKLIIPEEMYHGLEKGQVGIVTVRDGELYSFELE
jgi:hypothetical protein